jgi:hypothetical protein
MNAKIKSKTDMYLGLLLFLNGTINTWEILQIFQAIFDDFEEKLSKLQTDHALAEELINGYAQEKRNKRTAMALDADRIKNAVQAYASDNEMDVLFMSVNLPLSSLMEGRSLRSKNKCQMIHNKALAVVGQLGPYGVVAGDLTGLQLKISAYNAICSSPKHVKGQRKVLNSGIRKECKAIDKLLKSRMDKAAKSLINTAPEWVENYLAERRVYDPKTTHTEIIAEFKNKATGTVVEGVLLKAKGSKGAEFEIYSAENGVADKQINPEIYNLTWEIPGFESGEMKQVKVSPGEKEKLVIELIPSN